MNKVNAQNYYPFPDSIATWVNVAYDVGGGSFVLAYSEYFCMNDEDTLINNNTYTQLDYCLTGDYKGALRDTAGIVYYVPSDSTSEFLLYDFWAAPGDTINYYSEGSGSNGFMSQYIVQPSDISSVMINGQSRRELYIEGSSWVEGIGCMQGFFESPQGNLSNIALFLYCMSEAGTVLPGIGELSGTSLACNLFIGLDENSITNLNVYPNPSDGIIHAEVEGEIERAYFVNLLGEVIDMNFYHSNSILEMNTQELESGVYFLYIELENRTYFSKIVIE
ncbi:MAG: hypothetical protein ACJASQ_002658 [Crocinitomicaceae bacterium]|jgi:hypothetical protein